MHIRLRFTVLAILAMVTLVGHVEPVMAGTPTVSIAPRTDARRVAIALHTSACTKLIQSDSRREILIRLNATATSC